MTQVAVTGVPPVRLGPDTADRLPPTVRRPAYDRTRLKPGILHLGVGAFSRCHLAEHTEDALEADPGAWGIVGVNLRPPDLRPTLGAQSGLFCRELRDGEIRDRRLIGALLSADTLPEPGAPGRAAAFARALDAAADPAIRAVTLTITEKGYGHVPATGLPDPAHPDMVHDRAHPGEPASAPGFLLEVLARRFARGTPPPAIIPCDNVPANGQTLRESVLALAERDPRLRDRIAAEVTFLDTMVDRIVPATRPEDMASFAAETGVEDHALVVGEPFRMWVIEDRFAGPLPAWGKAGALFVPDVLPYEILKMRVVNGVQSTLCQLGLLSGFAFMADTVADPVFGAFARRTIAAEVAPRLPAVPGIDVDDYIDTTFRRLANPALRHETLQISTDGSQKIRQRLLEPLRAAIRAGTPHDGLFVGVAGWIAYASGRDYEGRPLDVRDPLGERTQAIAAATPDPADRVDAFLGLETVFGADLRADPALKARLATFVAALATRPARDVVRDVLAGHI